MQAVTLQLAFVTIIALTERALHVEVYAARILVLHPVHSGSHVLTVRKLADSLISRGHQVNIIKWKDVKTSLSENYLRAKNDDNITLTTLAMDNSDGRYFVLSKEKTATFTLPEDLLWNPGISASAILFNPVWHEFFPFLGSHCEALHSDPNRNKELKAKKYDLAIVDLIWNECSIGYARQVLKIPIVTGFWGISPTTLQPDTRVSFLRSSHSPFVKPFPGVQNYYLLRMIEAAMAMLSQVLMILYQSKIHSAMEKYVPDTATPLELHQGLDGIMINTDPSLELPRLLPPNYIYVGGMQIAREPRQMEKIPEHLAEWMENSNGVILFSLGATMDSKEAPKHIMSSFMEAFSKISHRIIFQFKGNRNVLRIPPNVKVVSGWIPQQALLAHPKIKLLVNHCGLQGLLEAVWNAVPIVCMPIVNDGEDNMNKAVAKGLGLGLNKDTLTPEEVLKTVKEVLSKKKFKYNAFKLSIQMRDTLEAPLDRATNFLEYLIRHDGAEHLKLPKEKISFVEYFWLDVIVGVCLFVGLVAFSLYNFINRHWEYKE